MKSWAAVVLALAGCGNLTDGQPCHSNLECSDALWCQPLCNGTATSACAPPCSDSAPCGGGAVCSASGQCQCDGAIGVDLGGADAVGSCGQSALPALIALSSTSGGAGAWVGVQASGVDAVAAANTITFGGVATPVLYQQADVDGVSSTLYVRVPSAAAAGNVVVALATCAGAAAQSLPFTIGGQPAPHHRCVEPRGRSGRHHGGGHRHGAHRRDRGAPGEHRRYSLPGDGGERWVAHVHQSWRHQRLVGAGRARWWPSGAGQRLSPTAHVSMMISVAARAPTLVSAFTHSCGSAMVTR